MAWALLAGVSIPSALSQESWNPFDNSNENFRVHNPQPPEQPVLEQPAKSFEGRPDGPVANQVLPSANSDKSDLQYRSRQPVGKEPGYTVPFVASSSAVPASPAVERGDLAPVTASETGLPFGLWQGLSVTDVEQLVAPLQLPVKSAALQQLWLRILVAEDGVQNRSMLSAVRAEALFRSGQPKLALQALQAALATSPDDPHLVLLRARTELALGNREVGCRLAKSAVAAKAKLTESLRGEAIILAGYCAVIGGNKAAAGLAGELARDEGYRAQFTLTVLAAIASGEQNHGTLPKFVQVIDYLLLKEAGFNRTAELIPHASPALLSVLIEDATVSSATKLLAGEEAARRNIVDGEDLAEIYRRQDALGREMSGDAAVRRAQMFQAAENIPSRLQRTRIVRQAIDEAQRDGLALPVMVALKPVVAQLTPAPEIGWFAVTAIEVMLAAADYDGILPWLDLAQSNDLGRDENFEHWRVLADMANPASKGRPVNLQPLEDLLQRGRLHGKHLRRLTTVLDALGYNVPIPVWDAANQTPVSTAGTLPPTGILTQLLAASEAKETARTALLVLHTLNGSEAQDAHLIALGDAIRGLRRAGLETDARRLAFEAVFAAWPRPIGS